MFGLNRERLRQMMRKEFRQTFRDPRSARILFVAPVIQLLLFGYAVNTDVRNTRTFVVDRDGTAESRQLTDAITASGYFQIVGRGERPAQLVDAMDHGTVVMGVEIPLGFAADLAAGRQASVQVLVDGSTANTANVALGYATQIITRFGLQHAREVLARAGPLPAVAGVDFRARAWYNPNLESRVYNVPAVMGTIVMMMSLLLTSLAVVREREIGTLEQLMVSPLKPAELILGKTLPVVLIALAQLVLVTGVALLWFGIPFRGSFALLAVAGLCYILSGLGIGLLISTISATQQEAFMSMFFFFLPAIMLSGFMFPVQNMPKVLQYLTLLDPIRHFLEVVRGVFLRGAGWGILYKQILILFAMGVSVLWFATTRFRKTTA
ncbi:MAG: ABC transporter permease [Gemmatimonadetes bacterium]|nr:ABC transporter permease [Gemmatimonadota bacterium]